MLNTIAIVTTVTAIFAYLNHQFIRLPTTIGVMLIGLVVSIAMIILSRFGLFDAAIVARQIAASVAFDKLVMDGMLSFLLFAGALHVNINDLIERKWSIALLATVGVVLTTFAFGFASFYLLSMCGLSVPLTYCFVFGALISATDPIAVLGILKKAGAPKSLEIKIVGESLFNDGVAVVVFLVLAGIASGTAEADAGHIGLLFAEEALGGTLYGIALGYTGYLMLKSLDNYQVEVLITLALVIGGYALAQALHVSGPLAIVVAGLMIGNKGRVLAMSDTTRHHIDTFWELIDEILNAVLFVLIGIELITISFTSNMLLAGVLLIPILLLVRLLSTTLLLQLLKTRMEFTKHAEWILTWGGLRGAVSIALALSLPQGEVRDVILSTTYMIVVFSILVQGLSVGSLIRWLLKEK